MSAFVLSLIALNGFVLKAQKGRIEPRDCVEVKYPDDSGFNGLYRSLTINWQRTEVAYIVKAPDVETNENDFELFVKAIDDPSTSPGNIVLHSKFLSHITWMEDGLHIVVLSRQDKTDAVVMVDIATKAVSEITRGTGNILQYSIDAQGQSLLITEHALEIGKSANQTNASALTDGHRIAFGENGTSIALGDDVLFLLRKTDRGVWSEPITVVITDQITDEQRTRWPRIRHVSMAPDGNRFIVSYETDNLGKDRWDVAVLYDIATTKTTIPFEGESDSIPLWARDSKSYLVAGRPPAGSEWATRDAREHYNGPMDADMFLVRPNKREVQEVLAHVPEHHEQPLAWLSDGTIVLHTSTLGVGTFREKNGKWEEASQFEIPLKPAYRYSVGPLVSSGGRVLGVYQTPNVPPDVFAFDPKTGVTKTITNLNPQFAHLKLAHFDTVSWNTIDGDQYSCFLFMPTTYQDGKRYPLVIQTKGNQGFFACDSGFNHDPAFIPQPVASSGMMYLIETTQNPREMNDHNALTGGPYPGGIDEPVREMHKWEGAIHELDSRGLVDPSKVGIIGFSRTGWHVEFDLAQSNVRYAAATASDNVQYSVGEYWLLNDKATMQAYNAMYGGPPYGASLEAWLKYSISFTLDRIHTPLLMENMGYGALDNIQGEVPYSLGPSYEVFAGLNQLSKPVDFYYYPLEEHSPNAPRARLASLQRNLDWYRFWLQGYERPNPEDPTQYKHWEHLRELRDADTKTANAAIKSPF